MGNYNKVKVHKVICEKVTRKESEIKKFREANIRLKYK
jgi:hypothetical protein